ncbi:MAG TPA: O-antigen ligase family protein [Verrucomicrobiae bacterium]|nr:O-antigen ligase family protein [Verrucomicrobiae bacterium]
MRQEAPRRSRSAAPVGDKAEGTILSLKEKGFALLCGIWIGVSFLKFGNPIILDHKIEAPKSIEEFLFTAWPLAWGYFVLLFVVLAGCSAAKPRFGKEHWPIGFFVIWLFWQFLSSARSIEPSLSNPAVLHFVSCAASFLLGWWALARVRLSGWLWTPILLGFFYVLFTGFDQHAGGLEATRKEFYAQTNWELYPKEYLLRIESNRIFGTLVYANALAGLILLLLPAVLAHAWQLLGRGPRVLRGTVVGLFLYLGLACLYWTGSKGGWLIAVIVLGVAAVQLTMPRRLKIALVSAGVVLGLGAFFLRFNSYFQKGATSVSARFIYWTGAVQITRSHPFLGSGPGTFPVLFKKLKPPDAEMAKLVHNDYLQQASDSGLPGGIAFAVGMIGSLIKLYRYSRKVNATNFAVWLGFLGWSLQAFIEFALYIPALAWPAALLAGSLWGAFDEKIRTAGTR